MKKNKKQKSKVSYKLIALFVSFTAVALLYTWAHWAINTMAPIPASAEVPKKATSTAEVKKEYAYNERVPVEVIKAEMDRVSELIGCDRKLFHAYVECESGYNNLARNPNSTAEGLGQYLIRTWEATQSYKVHHYSRTDYKPMIREMCLDLANGEFSKWEESRKCAMNKIK